ncbi:MAG: S49 family peptidase, partial [Bacteroidota bacterium]
RVSIASLYLLTMLVLGGTYLLYETKHLPTSYEYEKALQKVTKTPHIAKLTIYPTISYGGTGDNSLRKITHTIQLLSESNTNKGLVIDLAPCDQAIGYEIVQNVELCAFSHYIILKNALQAYKDKTNRKIIVHVTKSLAVPFLFILAIADQIILDTKTMLDNTNIKTFASIANYTSPEDSLLKVCTGNLILPIQLFEGKYKVKNDPKEMEKVHNAYQKAMRTAITCFEQTRDRYPFPLYIKQKSSRIANDYEDLWMRSLCTYLEDYGSGKQPEEVVAYIKTQIEHVPIIDLNRYINDRCTPEYTPQNRNAHRRTEACFETIMISGEINTRLVKKIRPLIQSVHYDPNIKGVIIVWDSPGGEVSPTKVLLHLLKKLNVAKPIIHVATSQCASGAYLLAAGTGEQLIAYPNASLGSIGVMADLTNVPLSLKSLEEIAKIQEKLAQTRQWMIETIAQNRAKRLGINQKIYRQKLYDTEARLYIATRAQEEQLIDRIGTLQDAIDVLKEQTKLDLPVYYSDNETKRINA